MSRLFTLINYFSWFTVLPLRNKYFLERMLSLLVLSIVYYRVRTKLWSVPELINTVTGDYVGFRSHHQFHGEPMLNICYAD